MLFSLPQSTPHSLPNRCSRIDLGDDVCAGRCECRMKQDDKPAPSYGGTLFQVIGWSLPLRFNATLERQAS